MSVSFARSCGAAIVLSLSAQAALADVSAQDVWSDWKSYMTTTGYKVTGTEAKSGNTLTVSDLLLEMPVMDAEASGSIAMPNIQFVENGDGTVNILLPKEMPLQFKMDGPDGAVEGTFIYSHDGSPMLVSGDTDEMTYDYATALMGFSLSGLTVPGEDIPAEAVKFKATLTDVVTKTVMTKTDLRSYEQTLTSASLDYDFGVTDPEGKGEGSFKGALQDLTFNGTTSIPDGTESADMAALLRNGLSASGRFDFAGGNSAISGRERRDSFAMESASQGGSISFDMSDAGLTYDVRQNQTELNISGSDIPFPLALSMAETGFKLMVPVTKSDEEQDFGLAVFLRDFDVPEVLWGMVDPTGALPHDPATIAIDLAGKAKLAFDMFDPASMEAIDNGELAPGELNALSVNALEVSVAGAELTGTGDFTFNNDDLETYDGMPAPSGEANLKLVGANTLLDTLISMGLVSDSDAMGARMMMGLLAVPGDGEDTLTSKIELTEDGQIKANGQRIK
ncbi:hypothetical protein NIT7321_03402 [Phaeobacter italicus]|uniref:DUF2125 domain-containing protein n=1 Tax=Phaeobacter italicus TaxID=481446 RepID=A0A0H5D656_9RHOB|nr:DUF2125 domain-containing protein [Phaeobacter italicus]CRL12524.1 hypothetical protein NIT7321_03402 [Phaeobacter italicus]